MDDLADFQAATDSPLLESDGTLKQPSRRSVFRDVPWRWSDVLIGLGPLLLFHTARVLIDPQSSLAITLSRLWLPLSAFSQAWILVVPLWIARIRKPSRTRRLNPRAFLVEALVALGGLPVVFAVMTSVWLMMTHLFGGTSTQSGPLGPLAG